MNRPLILTYLNNLNYILIFYLVFKKFILYENWNNYKVILKNNHLDKKDIKVCVCTVGKQENNIREFVDYYQKYGIDKIFLYDNNDEDGESFWRSN